jgi:Cu/Ag efflux pump CusA
MLSVPKARVVRGFSFFGVSFVYVIFEDGTDLYWALLAGFTQSGSLHVTK